MSPNWSRILKLHFLSTWVLLTLEIISAKTISFSLVHVFGDLLSTIYINHIYKWFNYECRHGVALWQPFIITQGQIYCTGDHFLPQQDHKYTTQCQLYGIHSRDSLVFLESSMFSLIFKEVLQLIIWKKSKNKLDCTGHVSGRSHQWWIIWLIR